MPATIKGIVVLPAIIPQHVGDPPLTCPGYPGQSPLRPGWTDPFGTIDPPLFDGTLPPDYQAAYIDLNNPSAPTPWGGTVSSTITTDVNPISGLAMPYCLFDRAPVGGPLVVTDNELLDAQPQDNHFAMQILIRVSGLNYRSNAQCEYR
jgi:hypothetical protein